ncbi:MAG: heme-copper oxidase subunit III [Dehalococcoidia bacterium]|nr:heme-copper oxidase subunit III [Dehalococcoidia bacterium]
MAVAASAAHGHATHNPVRFNRLGLWLFFFSESILFGLLLTTRFFLEGIEREHVDQHLGLAITIILLLSSLTAFTAETAIEHNNQRVANWFLMATIVLGIIFAAGVGFEWKTAEFSRHEAFGSVFFTMTGIHAAHVVSGIGILFLVWIQLKRGKFNSKNHWPVSGSVMYWHFVDVVWVFFYPALYLVK